MAGSAPYAPVLAVGNSRVEKPTNGIGVAKTSA